MVDLQEPLKITQLRSFPFTLAVLGLLCLCSSLDLRGQDDLNVHGVVSDAMTSSKLGAVDVTVHKDGNRVDNFTTRNNGKYEFYLSVGANYTFYFEKPGYVKRSIQIDSRNIPEEVVGAGIIMPTDMSMFAITAAMEGADLSIFDKPIGKASYDPAQADLVWDFQYTQKVKGEINAFIRNLQKKKKDVSEEDKAAEEAEAAFAKLVKEGDAAMSKEHYDEAVEKYRAALDMKPDDQNVKAKLGDAETQRDRLREEKLKNKAYDDAIAAADDAFKNEDYESAVAKYKEALKVKPAEAYPTAQIETAEFIMKDLAEQSAKQREYDENMRAGNRAADDENYAEAVAAFERAMAVMPGEKEAEKRRDAVADLLAKQKSEAEAQAAYDAAIKKADALYESEKYLEAKAEYAAALEAKPKDGYAAERQSSCDTQLAAIAEAEARRAEFDQAMTEGNKALDDQAYPRALEKFDAALALFPDDANAAAKRTEAQDLLDVQRAEAQKKEDYERLMSDADRAFGKEDYTDAEGLYAQAAAIMPDEKRPKERINEIRGILAAREAAEAAQQAYDAAMKAAREAVSSEAFDTALEKYDEALLAKENDPDAVKERAEAEKKKQAYEERMAEDAAYAEKIAEADKKRDADALDAASALYAEALSIKPQESYPQKEIDKIEKIKAERAAQRAEEERLAALREQFDAAMDKGEAAFAAEDFATAVAEFSAAADLLPENEQAPRRKADAEAKQAEKAEAEARDAAYADAVSRADADFAAEKYEAAISGYASAADIKPEEAYPADQIALIEERLAALAAAKAEAEAKAKNEQVAALLSAGDRMVAENKFDGGIDKYTEARTILPEREDITRKISDAEAAREAWLKARAEDEAYAEAIAEADKAFGAENWETARSKYRRAEEIKPEESYPGAQIGRIDDALAAIAAAEAEAAERAKNEKVDALLSAGDLLAADEDFDSAINKYTEALSIVPERTEISKKIADAEAAQQALLQTQAEDEAYAGVIANADKAFAAENWEAALRNYSKAAEIKPNEKYPGDQIAEIEAKIALAAAEAEASERAEQERAEALISAGDRLVSDEDFDGGIGKYSEAAAILPERKDIDQKIRDAEAARKAWLMRQADDEAYNGVIAKADRAFEAKNWEEARKNYRQATEIKPDEQYPQDRLALTDKREAEEADALFAARKAEADALIDAGDALVSEKSFDTGIDKYTAAADLMPERTEIPEKIAAAQAAKAAWAEARANAEAYDGIIAEADQAFAAEDWTKAEKAYREALDIKPNETYPKDQLALAEANQKAQAEARAAAEKAAVDALVAEGDNAMAASKYGIAADKYEEALNAAPARDDIRAKLDKARDMQLSVMESAALDEAYSDAVDQGDKAFKKESWDAAVSHYREASGLKPNERYPKDKIAEINGLLDAQAKREEETAAAETRRKYDALIAAGDAKFGKQKFSGALDEYREALALLPQAETAKKKIAETEKAIRERDALAADRSAYENAVSEADVFFNDEDYEMALMRYEDALDLRPGEKHPSKRVAEINKILESMRLESEREAEAAQEAEYAAAVKRGDDAMRKQKYEAAISAFEDALSVKPDEQYPQSRIERARLSLSEIEADRQRLAQEKAARAAEQEEDGDYRTVSRKSEEQAEAFMREALDAQEREKYERIKKLKEREAALISERNENSALLRSANFEELMAYYDYSRQIAEEGDRRREKRAANSEKYKRTLYKNMDIQAERGRSRVDEAYTQIRKDAMGIRDAEHRRMESNLDELREIARKNRLFTEEYGNYYRKRSAEAVASGTAEIQKTTADFNTQLDERKQQADLQRSKNLEEAYNKMRGDAKHTDFFRMELALEYPQGVTEESSTMGNKVIITRIVVSGSKGDEYRKVLDKAGNYYFKNGQSISEITWNRETLDAFYKKD